MPYLQNTNKHSDTMTAPISPEETLARFEELSVLEEEFEDAELELSKFCLCGSHNAAVLF